MMDAIAKNNRDVDSNPRGVLGSCVDAGLGGWLGFHIPAVLQLRASSRRSRMSHRDPLARCCPTEGRAGVGFVPRTVHPGPPPGASPASLLPVG